MNNVSILHGIYSDCKSVRGRYNIFMDKEETMKHNEKHLGLSPITLKEVHEAAHRRLSLISKEFRDGFEFLINHPKSVTFFGSSRLPTGNPYYEKARSLAAKIIHALGHSVITGGGPGIMEAANKGAFEAKGNSIGLTIKLPKEQVTNPYLTHQMGFHYFFSRKVCLSFSSEAYIFFPGGFGTLDEFSEILTLIQTHKIPKVPIVLVGDEYWKAMDVFIKDHMLKNEMIDLEDMHLYQITEDEEKIIEIIRQVPITNGVPYREDETK